MEHVQHRDMGGNSYDCQRSCLEAVTTILMSLVSSTVVAIELDLPAQRLLAMQPINF